MPGWKYEKTITKIANNKFKSNSESERPIVAKKLMLKKSSSWFARGKENFSGRKIRFEGEKKLCSILKLNKAKS